MRRPAQGVPLSHGYPWLVHRLTYRRNNRNLHVRGYKEEGTITTAFDIRVQNELDRFNLVQDVVDRLPHLGTKGDYLKQLMRDRLDLGAKKLAFHPGETVTGRCRWRRTRRTQMLNSSWETTCRAFSERWLRI